MTLTFKIQIRGIKKPPVWRRLQIPADFTFNDFHRAIQAAFGWEEEHLYQFQKQPYDQDWSITVADDELFGFDSAKCIDARTVQVGKFLEEKKLTKLVYVYDFGDDWIHDLTLEKTSDEATHDHPVCLSGKGACPPEDVGGIWAYEEMKRLFAEEPDDEETQSYMDWLGLDDPREFDPEAYDLVEVNDSLKRIKATPVSKGKGKTAKKAALPSELCDDLGISDMMDGYDDIDDFYIQGYYNTTEKPQRYELHVEHGSEWRILQVPSSMTLDGVAQLIMLAFGAGKLPEKYEFQNIAEDFRYLSDADDYALSEDYWEMDNTDTGTLSELLTSRSEAAELRLKKRKKVADTYILTLEKKGRYSTKTPHAIDLLQADDKADTVAIGKSLRKFEADNPLPKGEK